jgi:TonB family protein
MSSMLQKNRANRGRRLGFWLLLALVIHAEALLVVGVSLYFYAPRNADLAAGESIEITTVDDETAQKVLAELDKAEEEAKQEEEKKELESKQSPGQVVDLPKPAVEERPEDAKFASEYDSKVAKESRRYGRFDQQSRQGDATGEAEESRPAAPASPPPGALSMRAPEGRPSRPSPAAPEPRPPSPASPEQGPPAPPIDPEGALPETGASAQQPVMAPPPTPGSAPRVPPGASPSLTPSQQQLARAIGGGTQDHLKDIDEGDETALNAKKWKFASFFNRVKAQVREHWRPADVYRRRDPSGSIYGNKDRYTLLRVQLKPDGSLANVVLETPSGVEFLDDEAIEAFKQAQPFPNPPPQLVDASSGMIDFRFGFYFEISGAPRFKIFRYNSM